MIRLKRYDYLWKKGETIWLEDEQHELLQECREAFGLVMMESILLLYELHSMFSVALRQLARTPHGGSRSRFSWPIVSPPGAEPRLI